jgi:NAD(P)H-hydrate repair Nnr-like enzyme with NAD(P)H-hydrate dehydratase domain
VLLGSGTRGRDIVEQRIFADAIENAECPIILDGGALTFASGSQGIQALRKRAAAGRACVMTPHAGEAAVLAEGVGMDVVMRPEKLALRLSEAYGACICLKGPDTFVADAKVFPGRVFAMREGGAVLAKAGTGDILAGIIAGLCAQGLDSLECACAGSYLHALAGKRAELRLGDISACAEDVLAALPEAILQVCGY